MYDKNTKNSYFLFVILKKLRSNFVLYLICLHAGIQLHFSRKAFPFLVVKSSRCADLMHFDCYPLQILVFLSPVKRSS